MAPTVMLVMSAAVPHHPRVASHAVNDHDRVPSPSHRAAASPPDVTLYGMVRVCSLPFHIACRSRARCNTAVN